MDLLNICNQIKERYSLNKIPLDCSSDIQLSIGEFDRNDRFRIQFNKFTSDCLAAIDDSTVIESFVKRNIKHWDDLSQKDELYIDYTLSSQFLFDFKDDLCVNVDFLQQFLTFMHDAIYTNNYEPVIVAIRELYKSKNSEFFYSDYCSLDIEELDKLYKDAQNGNSKLTSHQPSRLNTARLGQAARPEPVDGDQPE